MVELYEIDKDYLNKLHDYGDEKSLIHNIDKQTRKFIAIKIKFNDCDYYVPLSSPDKSDFIFVEGKRIVRKTSVPTIMRFFSGTHIPSHYLGKLLFNNMIPAPEHFVSPFIIENLPGGHYKTLMRKQYYVLRSKWIEIQKRARIVYNLKMKNENYGYVKAIVDFSKLEEICKEEIAFFTVKKEVEIIS